MINWEETLIGCVVTLWRMTSLRYMTYWKCWKPTKTNGMVSSYHHKNGKCNNIMNTAQNPCYHGMKQSISDKFELFMICMSIRWFVNTRVISSNTSALFYRLQQTLPRCSVSSQKYWLMIQTKIHTQYLVRMLKLSFPWCKESSKICSVMTWKKPWGSTQHPGQHRSVGKFLELSTCYGKISTSKMLWLELIKLQLMN